MGLASRDFFAGGTNMAPQTRCVGCIADRRGRDWAVFDQAIR
jgi:hypothetical protein